MKDKPTTSKAHAADPPSHPVFLLPSYSSSTNYQRHHDYRSSKKAHSDWSGPIDYDSGWRDLPHRRARDLNLLANSLSSRLRRKMAAATASASRSAESSSTTLARTEEDPSREEGGTRSKGRARSDSMPTSSFPSKTRPSILKRTLSKEEAERNQRTLREQLSTRSDIESALEDGHPLFPDVRRHYSEDRYNGEAEAGKKDGRQRRRGGSTVAFPAAERASVAASVASLARTDNHLVWVKRAGIFQPVDKYNKGRQTLCGEDIPYTHYRPVDYETVTVQSSQSHSQEEEPEHESTSLGPKTPGWHSSTSLRQGRVKKKGLNVTWKKPAASHEQSNGESGGVERAVSVTTPTSVPLGLRPRGANSAQGDGTYKLHKPPRYNPGHSRVPVVGLRWQVFVPTAGGAGGDCRGVKGASEANAEPSLGCENRSPTTASSHPPRLQPQHPLQTVAPSDGSGSLHRGGMKRAPRQQQQPQQPRDVHPVTTAMEREGTSISRTKWQVPGPRQVPPLYVSLEDLLDSRVHQWNPAAVHKHAHNMLGLWPDPAGRYTARATLDDRSLQDRIAEARQDFAAGRDAAPPSARTSETADDGVELCGLGGSGDPIEPA